MAENGKTAAVGVVMGSDSDWSVMEACVKTLDEFGVASEVKILSAHRSPQKVHEYAASAASRGMEVIIAAAGMAAHLAGVMAANTILPVIGVPINAGPLGGVDALLSTVQMPPGVPVAAVGIGQPGAKNAAILAVQILALKDADLRRRLDSHKQKLSQSVDTKNEELARKLRAQ